jgi:hypothetical protein
MRIVQSRIPRSRSYVVAAMIVICMGHARALFAQAIPVPLGARQVMGLNMYGRVQGAKAAQRRRTAAQEAERRRQAEIMRKAEAERQQQLLRNRQAAAARSRTEKAEREERSREWNLKQREHTQASPKDGEPVEATEE